MDMQRPPQPYYQPPQPQPGPMATQPPQLVANFNGGGQSGGVRMFPPQPPHTQQPNQYQQQQFQQPQKVMPPPPSAGQPTYSNYNGGPSGPTAYPSPTHSQQQPSQHPQTHQTVPPPPQQTSYSNFNGGIHGGPRMMPPQIQPPPQTQQPPQNQPPPQNRPPPQTQLPPQTRPPPQNQFQSQQTNQRPIGPPQPQPFFNGGQTGDRILPPHAPQQPQKMVPPPPNAPYYNGSQSNLPPPPHGSQPQHQQQFQQQQPQQQQQMHVPPAPHAPYYNGGIGYGGQPPLQQQQTHQQQPQTDSLNNKFAGMSIQKSWSQLWGNDAVNLMTEKNIKSKSRDVESPTGPHEPEVNCNRNILCCTLNKVPDTASLLQKSRLPFGILIHPFKDDDEIPVIQDNPIVRCRACRTYINPFVRLLDQRRWQCNLCHRVNDLPEEFMYDIHQRQFIDCTTRPEMSSGSVEHIASVEYMVRPPQPAAYLFVFDCSRHATQIGYIPVLARSILASLDDIPGDSRALIGFVAFDSKLHFFNLDEKQPTHLVMPDIDDVFLPSPDNLLANLHSKRALIESFLTEQLPNFPFETTGVSDTGSALGPALSAAYKIIAPIGGRVTLIQATLPNIGGSSDTSVLANREDPNNRASGNAVNVNSLTPMLNPGTDFYKKLALECSEHQVAVDLFNLSPAYSDLATVGSISKFCGGNVYYYGGSTGPSTNVLARFEADMRHYLTRNIGFEAVMRMRVTRGLSIHTFHGNFFVRSTDLLALPNVNPDAGYAMQMSIDEDLKDYNQVCFQAAILYTSAAGERRIRVHTLSLPVVSTLPDVINNVDQEAVAGMLAKMAVDRSLSSSISDAREALINAISDLLQTYKQMAPTSASSGGLVASYSFRLLPLYTLALLKHIAYRVGISTKLDERVYAMERMKSLPLCHLMDYIYPNMYNVHTEFDYENEQWPQPLQLSFANIERNGVYLLDTFDHLYLYICKSIHPQWLSDVFGVTQWAQIPDDGDQVAAQPSANQRPGQQLITPTESPQHAADSLSLVPLPLLENQTSKRIRTFIDYLIEQRPFKPQFHILREDSRLRYSFLQYMFDDRNESAFSYYEFLQHLQQQVKN